MTTIPNDAIQQHKLVAYGYLVLCCDEKTLQPHLYDPATKTREPTSQDFDEWQSMLYFASRYYIRKAA